MYATNELKKGLIIEFEGAPHMVESVKVNSPQGRAGNTITRVRLRNLKSKQKTDKSFRGSETFGAPDFEKRACQVLYEEQDAYHFMDKENFEQFHLQKSELEWERNFLHDAIEGLQAFVVDDEVLGLELPTTVELDIKETPPSIKGASATARTKPATLVTGFVLQVPEHISPADKLRVDTRTGDFIGRA